MSAFENRFRAGLV